MALTREGARLTETHRRQQVALSARVVAEATLLWPLLDPKRIDETRAGWVTAMLNLILSRRAESASLASSYVRLFRAVEVGGEAPVPLDDVPTVAIRTSLEVTGPVAVKQALARGLTVEQAQRSALGYALGSTTRHVANGGRAAVLGSVRVDRSAFGWARVTDGHPCSFCALLAGRGPKYKSERSAEFPAHDSCGCTAEPVYGRDAPWPGNAEAYRALYDEHAAGRGRDARNAFRRAYEGR